MSEKNKPNTDKSVNKRFLYEKCFPAKKADGKGKRSSDCGDTIEFSINLKNDVIDDIVFQINGCTNTFEAAKAAASLVQKKHIKEAMQLSSPQAIDERAKLPEPNRHCADLASEALREALRNALINAREPWRKLYRKS